jgi:1-acyl-sn-glycerol-3-phosphate acyltransferase
VGENYIFIANHSSYLDTPMIFRCMPSMVLPLATESFSKVPLFGFLYKKMTIMVDRNSVQSRRRSVRRMRRALSSGKSIFIFPEGGIVSSGKTLNSFYDGAFRLAIESGIPILPVIFPDTVDRWTPGSFWNWHPGKSRAVFLKEISAKNTTMSDMKKLAFSQIEKALIKYRKPLDV